MAKEVITADIDGKKIKLTNLEKILYPGIAATKAEIIKYFLDHTPYILPYLKGCPLTLIRFPDGIEGKRFYSKNKPDWSPEWVQSVHFPGDKENDYIIAADQATLAWLANLAALELHPMNVALPNLNLPHQFIFDLDPSEEIDFPKLKGIALELKTFLESHGYCPFIKTSGGKGLHIYVPIIPEIGQSLVFETVKKLADEFVSSHKDETTLNIRKEKRKGKVLLDIYRNHKAQSCVAPWSLRGKPKAPISTPFNWELLSSVSHSQQWNLGNIDDYINSYGDPWSNYRHHAVPLQGKKTPNLDKYTSKRNFTKTPEPTDRESIATPGNAYVIQLHDASNLHYDLRLENKGVLESWAIPKGMPTSSDIKRLAIRTEDHPLKYLTFEGKIPKGQYGGGEMWVFDTGTYQIITRKENKIRFKLGQGSLKGEYLMYNTGENHWLIEKKAGKSMNLESMTKPMLAGISKEIITDKKYFYEIKWDGIRAIFVIEEGKMKIISRNGNDITSYFPEIAENIGNIEAQRAVIDGEIVYLDQSGVPDFSKVVGRIHLSGKNAITKASRSRPATAYLFDLLYLDGKDCRQEHCERRRMWLEAILSPSSRIRYSEAFADGQALFIGIESHRMEGVMCKLKSGKYLSGQRSDNWLKIKVRQDDTAFVIGWTEGEGDRSGVFGALHLAKSQGNGWKYMGKVGTGFDTSRLKSIMKKIKSLKTIQKPIKETVSEPSRSHWIEASLQARITYASISSNGTYREPVFVSLVEPE